MLLDRAAAYFQEQGYRVRVRPCIIGDTGAIHTPDLHVVKDGQRQRVVFVFDALDGTALLETRAHMSKDMDADASFVIGEPSAEVRGWMERRKMPLLEPNDLPVLPEPPPPPPAPEAPPAPIVAPAPPTPNEPVYVPDDGGAMFLPGRKREPESEPMVLPEEPVALSLPTRRRDAPPPIAGPADDGDAMLLPSRSNRNAPAQAFPRPAAPRHAAPPPADVGEDGGVELLPSKRSSARDGEAMAKHDPRIWDPRNRLAEVKRVAKAGSFDSTAGTDEPGSDWLKKLRDTQGTPPG